MECEVEVYERASAHREWKTSVDAAGACALLDEWSSAWSATIVLRGEAQVLVLALHEGRCAAMLSVGEDEFYDRLGVPESIESVRFVHGGQESAYPARFIVGLDAAKEIVGGFVRIGRLSLDDREWERQGDGVWAQRPA